MVAGKDVEIIDLTVSSPSSRPTQQEPPSKSDNVQPECRETTPDPTTHGEISNGLQNDKNSSLGSKKQKRIRRRSESLTNDGRSIEEDLESPAVSAAEGLFFVDTTPVPLPPAPIAPEVNHEEDITSQKLLLPAHVSVFGSTPIEILPPATTLEDDSIQFLDYDDGKVFRRYWENQEAATTSRMVCKHCGAEGKHKTYECPVIICLTCGARDDHPTRSCPISKVCFTCGMKGHINATCPNRGSNGLRMSSRFIDCERCSSTLHKTNECPTWWRMYAYLSDAGQEKVLSSRKEKHGCKSGEGGEGYIGDDEWCYSCGNSGHLGDDCTDSNRPNQLQDPSAFSLYNVASGPFYNPDSESHRSSKATKRSRPRESFMDLEKVPDDVGRRGKDKVKSRLGKMLQVDDDPDDWFNQATRAPEKSAPKKPNTIQFSQSLQNNKRRFDQPSGPTKSSLLDRLGDHYHEDETSTATRRSKKRKNRTEERRDVDDHRGQDTRDKDSQGYSNSYRRDRDKDRSRDRNRDRNRNEHNSHRPRYKGGYS